MLFDGRKIHEGKLLETDVCIVGGGASGITLAREFVNAPFDVLLCESGGSRFDHRTQWLYRAENIGRPYFDMTFTKQRYWGGASNKWYGRCRPLDSIDLEKRPWVEHSGWPFGREELDPFYARAHAVCQLGSDDYDPRSWETPEKEQLPLEASHVETKIFQFSPPTNFATEYGSSIESAPNIQTFIFSNAVSISLDRRGRKVDRIVFATLRGNRFCVKANVFILAASALEVTRLLLVSNDVHPHGIGNQHDLVGRFFMEHPHIFNGELVTRLTDRQSSYYKVLDYDIVSNNLGTVGALGIKEDSIRRERMLNASAFFIKRKSYKINDRYFSKGGLALAQVMDTFRHTNAPGLQFFRYAAGVLSHLGDAAGIIGQRLKNITNSSSTIALCAQLETEPNPYSRVTLSPKKDRLGLNKLRFDWRLTRFDLESFEQFQKMLFEGLRAAGSEVRPFNHETDEAGWPVTMVAGKHHMGTTRMHQDPKKGVVDANCKVHGVANLFIAGSSTFPTSGHANPMLTIVALAIRLADYVKGILPAGSNTE